MRRRKTSNDTHLWERRYATVASALDYLGASDSDGTRLYAAWFRAYWGGTGVKDFTKTWGKAGLLTIEAYKKVAQRLVQEEDFNLGDIATPRWNQRFNEELGEQLMKDLQVSPANDESNTSLQ